MVNGGDAKRRTLQACHDPVWRAGSGRSMAEPGKEASLNTVGLGNQPAGPAARPKRTPLAVENSVGELAARSQDLSA